MELKQLASFEAVIKYESFTHAAEKLFLSQPTVSAHVQQLEKELGVRLIDRTTKVVTPTPKGLEVYKYAKSILNLADKMERACRAGGESVIHLGASTIPSAYLLPKLLMEYGKAYPDTYFVIHQDDSQGIIQALKNGYFDVGLVGMDCPDPEFSCTPFCADKLVLITPVNDHFLALKRQGADITSLLLSEPVIMREKGSGSQKSAELFIDELGISEKKLNVTARVNDQEAIKNLVAEGFGISIISGLAAQNYIDARRVLDFPLSGKTGVRKFYTVVRKDAASPQLKRFAGFLKKYFREED